jgi:hypothetical protein
MHTLTGSWTANLSKSTRHANHQFYGATMRFEVAGDDVLLTFGGVNASGKTEEGSQTIRADGQGHPDPAAPGLITTARVDERSFEVVATKDGAVVGSGKYEVSENGEEMTATMSGIDGSGRQFDQVIVFDRS